MLLQSLTQTDLEGDKLDKVVAVLVAAQAGLQSQLSERPDLC